MITIEIAASAEEVNAFNSLEEFVEDLLSSRMRTDWTVIASEWNPREVRLTLQLWTKPYIPEALEPPKKRIE